MSLFFLFCAGRLFMQHGIHIAGKRFTAVAYTALVHTNIFRLHFPCYTTILRLMKTSKEGLRMRTKLYLCNYILLFLIMILTGCNTQENYSSLNSSTPSESGSLSSESEQTVLEKGQISENMTFRKGTGENDEIILTGNNIQQVEMSFEGWPQLILSLDADGTAAFAQATEELSSNNGWISVWLKDEQLFQTQISAVITNGLFSISTSDPEELFKKFQSA